MVLRKAGWATAAMAWVVTGAAVFSGGCETNPATGRSQFIVMSRATEIQTGTELKPQLTQEYGGELSDAVAQAYLTEVGSAMAATTEGDFPSLPWEFTLLDSDVINAFALPGGKVFISRGLVSRMADEAQMAGVIGHEIGHVTARHVNDRMLSVGLTQFGQTIVDAALAGRADAIRQVGTAVYGLGGQGVITGFSRGQELESDALGIRYMTNVGYDPVAQREVMEILAQASAGPRQVEFLSTHPYPETRIRRIDELLATEYAGATAGERHRERFEDRMLNRIGRSADRRGVMHWCGTCRMIASAD